MRPLPQFTYLNHGAPWASPAPPFQLESTQTAFEADDG